MRLVDFYAALILYVTLMLGFIIGVIFRAVIKKK
jgi:hypothetical protein